MPSVQSGGISWMSHPKTKQFVLFAFIALVLIGGGASRADALSLVYLRPAAVLALTYALWIRLDNRECKLGAPFWIVASLGLLTLLQLVPLPPAMWSQLPARDLVVAVHESAEIPLSWRPLSLTPSATWNSLFALTIPLATMALYAIQTEETRKRLLVVLAGSAFLTMAWGVLQLAGGSDSIFYHYRIHTEDRAIGLFSNRNHTAMFISLSILAAAAIVTQLDRRKSGFYLGMTLLGGLVLLAVPFVLIVGSRAGLILTVLAMLIAAFASLRSMAAKQSDGLSGSSIPNRFMTLLGSRVAIVLAGLGTLFAVGAVAVMSNRGDAFMRLSASGREERLSRSEILPFLVEMTGDQFPWGGGFGSFSELFKQYESTEMLSTFYLNQAHNDWAQFLIEGGLAAAIILLVGLGWLALRSIRLIFSDDLAASAAGLCIAAMFVLMGLGSVVDYPLRVPIIMMALSISAMFLSEQPNFFTPQHRARSAS